MWFLSTLWKNSIYLPLTPLSASQSAIVAGHTSDPHEDRERGATGAAEEEKGDRGGREGEGRARGRAQPQQKPSLAIFLLKE